jgi:hypothetical protein
MPLAANESKSPREYTTKAMHPTSFQNQSLFQVDSVQRAKLWYSKHSSHPHLVRLKNNSFANGDIGDSLSSGTDIERVEVDERGPSVLVIGQLAWHQHIGVGGVCSVKQGSIDVG